MVMGFQQFIVPDGRSKWLKADPHPTASKVAVKGTMFVVLASGPSLAAAGVDIQSIRSVDFGDFAELTAGEASEGFDVRLATIEPMVTFSAEENPPDWTTQLTAALGALGKMPPEKIFQAVVQLEAGGAQAREARNSLYQVLTAQEMADRMQCSLPVVYQREAANEFFSALAPGRKNGKRFPAFLLSDKLDRALLKQVIQAYKEAGVGTTLMWSFLRSPQNEFGGLTPVEMLLGAVALAYSGMSRDERAAAIMDVVDEELSRVR